MKKLLLTSCISLLVFSFSFSQIPASWNSVGIGGGGSLFNPSINPANPDEFYVACDMSEYLHSTDYGLSYSTVDFNKIQSGSNGVVRFTNNPNILYAITDSGDYGLPVKSTDGGQTWVTLSGNPDPSEFVYYLFADYDNPNIMIMSYYDQVYITTNGGTSFTLVHNANNSGSGVLVGGAFFDGNNIYIGTNDGVYVSTNGGTSFSLNTATGIPTNQQIYFFSGAKSGSTTRFFVLTGNKSDIYAGLQGYDYWQFAKGIYSLDYGSSSWVQKMNGINLNTDFPMECAMAENDINTCYLAGSNTSGYPNVLKTTDGGNTWTHVFNAQNNVHINPGWCGTGGDRDWGYAEVFFGLAVAKNDANRVVVSDFGFVHKTSDGGANWQQAYLNVNDQNAQGVNITKGKNYHGIDLENTSCWQVFWSDQNNLWAGFSDIRGIRSNDAGSSWNFNYTGNDQNSTYRIVKNPSNGILYEALSTIHDIYQSTHLTDATLDASGSGKIIYSVDNGTTWQILHDFSHPVFWLAVDPNNSNRMYASVINYGSSIGGIYVTSDLQDNASSSWTKLPDPPRTQGHPATVICLNDGKVLCTYSGRRDASGNFTTSSGVFLYNGTSWTDLSINPGMYYWCKDVVLDPNDVNQNTWYVGVFKGWGSTTVNNAGGGLYKTTDRGAHWTRVNSFDRVTSCTFDPNNANQIYMTTETKGLWYSNNINSATPTFSLMTSYPFRQPERVFFNPFNPSEIWVTSFGNGMRVGNSGCAAPTVSISADSATTFCKPGSVTLNAAATNATSYQWTKNAHNISGATSPSYVSTASGSYAVTVSNSCSSATSNIIVVTANPKPAATITPNGTVNMCAGQSTLLTANSGNNLAYQWKKGGKDISGETNQTYNATAAGKYKVVVTDINTGCSKTSAATTINITCKEEEKLFYAEVHPNPSNSVFEVQFNDEAQYEIRVFDILGQLIFSDYGSGKISFGKNFSPGAYLLEITDAAGHSKSLRLIKE